MWNAAGFLFCMWNKYSATLPSSVMKQPLVLSSAIKKVCYISSHMESDCIFAQLTNSLPPRVPKLFKIAFAFLYVAMWLAQEFRAIFSNGQIRRSEPKIDKVEKNFVESVLLCFFWQIHWVRCGQLLVSWLRPFFSLWSFSLLEEGRRTKRNGLKGIKVDVLIIIIPANSWQWD